VVVGENVPQVDGGHEEGGVPWVVVQVAPAFAGSFRMVEVSARLAVIGRMAEVGETESEIARTVTVTEPDFVESEREVAVIVTGKFAVGGVGGAV
jgi:hypothetical protein